MSAGRQEPGNQYGRPPAYGGQPAYGEQPAYGRPAAYGAQNTPRYGPGSVQGAHSGPPSPAYPPHRVGIGEPARVDLRPTTKGIVIQILGTVLMLAIGGVALTGGLTSDQGLAPIIVGAIFMLLGLLLLFLLPKVLRARALEIGPTGLEYHDPKGNPWAVRWTDLATVDVKYGYPRARRSPLSEGVVVALEFTLRAGAEAQYPDLRHYRRGNAYRLALGRREDLLGPLAQALGAFAPPQIFGGVTNLGSITAMSLI
ncbi:hypothetical protein [Occultella gossypii]|uniref:DUF3592 domain-containing protein n=1 Tax=Occultella gossypii TaxID=2800820 RepID=A0ABS7SHB5_9MICO|nr:hypothetical protein [Occultella gossypii]MBZ2199744.1 hypothetical protein [Occultella gossypii]